MKERDFKREIIPLLRKRYDTGYVLQEVQVQNSIVDIAIFSDEGLVGVEIKSEKDSLTRLKRQIKDYNSFFKFNILVCHKKHTEKAKKIIPYHFGLIEIWSEDGEVLLNELRIAKENLSRNHKALVNFMWKDELVKYIIKYSHIIKNAGRFTKKDLNRMTKSYLKNYLNEEHNISERLESLSCFLYKEVKGRGWDYLKIKKAK